MSLLRRRTANNCAYALFVAPMLFIQAATSALEPPVPARGTESQEPDIAFTARKEPRSYLGMGGVRSADSSYQLWEEVNGDPLGRGEDDTLPVAPKAIDLEEAEPERDGFYIGPLRIGGAFRTNFIHKDWGQDYRGAGEFTLDTARLNLDLKTDTLIGALEYRYYRDKHANGHDYHMLKHGWLGWKWGDGHELHAGVHRVPFGILPYASHNWFFQLPYYVGLEDDYDLGLKYLRKRDGWDFQVAYYYSDEGHWSGDSDDSARYSYDLVREGTEGNEERNQFNMRLARTFEHSEDFNTELGLSLQYGLIPNDNTGNTGDHTAIAAHINGNYGRWNLMLQAMYYRYDLENDSKLDASPDGSFVVMGAYDAAYHVASEASIYSVGVSYTLPVDWGAIESVTFYNDFSIMHKNGRGFEDSFQNVLGCSFKAERFFVYIDLATGKNHPWLGGDWTDGFARGDRDAEWNTRFNINIGFYF
jgi:hypothetical protein